MERLGSPLAAVLPDAGRGKTAGGAESTSWVLMPLSGCHPKPPSAFFSLEWSFSFLSDTKLPQGSRVLCRGGIPGYRDLMTRNQDSPTMANTRQCSSCNPCFRPLSGK